MNNISSSPEASCCSDPQKPTDSILNAFRTAIDRISVPILGIAAVILVLSVTVPEQTLGHIKFTGISLFKISPFLLLSVGIAAFLKASGADQVVARAFEGNPARAIFVASIFGALSPFCSCGVIPLVAGLLASGVPIAAVLAFCIASPIMDPEMFVLTAAGLGLEFTLVKTAAAIGMGLFAGYVTLALSKAGLLQNALKGIAMPSCQTAVKEQANIHWTFWKNPHRNTLFWTEARQTIWFLGRWLSFAFLLESLMISYIPADTVTPLLGSENVFAMPLAALIGIPAYMNGYAAIPLVRGLMDLGMSPATALTFMLAGSVTSIPAAIAIWSLVKPKLFVLYLGFAVSGSLIAGILYQSALS